MNFESFLNFNTHCPICDNKLTPYLQVQYSVCYKGECNNNNYLFTPFKLTNKDANSVPLEMTVSGNNCSFEGGKVSDTFYIFFLCKEAGIVDLGDPPYDYHIKPFYGCYYRSSQFLKVKEGKVEIIPDVTHASSTDNIMNEEFFAFSKRQPDLLKAYFLKIDSCKKNTTLIYYDVTPEQEATKGFKPKKFNKELPLLEKRPDFTLQNRDQIISKFDSWILLS